jgi:hypothetical protein
MLLVPAGFFRDVPVRCCRLFLILLPHCPACHTAEQPPCLHAACTHTLSHATPTCLIPMPFLLPFIPVYLLCLPSCLPFLCLLLQHYLFRGVVGWVLVPCVPAFTKNLPAMPSPHTCTLHTHTACLPACQATTTTRTWVPGSVRCTLPSANLLDVYICRLAFGDVGALRAGERCARTRTRTAHAHAVLHSLCS